MAHLPNVFPSMTASEAAGAMRPAPEWARALGAAHARFERMRALTERAVVPTQQFEEGAPSPVAEPAARAEAAPSERSTSRDQRAEAEQNQGLNHERRRATDDTAKAIAELRAEVERMKSAAAEPMRFTAAKDANGRWDIRTVGDE